MAILTTSGRRAAASGILNETFYLAWGTGDPAWDETPASEPANATELIAEVGRRRVSQKSFCEPDPDGPIEQPDGHYRLSVEPTNQIYLRFTFDYGDASAETLREAGVFLGGSTLDTLPPEQAYFTPDQVIDPGLLLILERFTKIIRDPANREQFEYILTI